MIQIIIEYYVITEHVPQLYYKYPKVKLNTNKVLVHSLSLIEDKLTMLTYRSLH